MKKQFISIMLYSALLMGGASTFTSCSDCSKCEDANVAIGTLSDDLSRKVQALQEQVNSLQTALNGSNGLIKQVEQLKSDLTTKENELKQLIEQKNNATSTELKQLIETKITNVNTDITNIKTDIATATADITTLKERMASAEIAINEAKQAANEAKEAAATAESNSKAYTDEEIQKAVAAADLKLQEEISKLKEQIATCHTDCKAYTDEQVEIINGVTDNLKELIDANTTNIQTLFSKYAELESKVKADSTLLAQVKADKTELNTAVENLQSKIDEKVDTTDFNAVKEQVDKNTALAAENKETIDSIKTVMVNLVSKQELDNKASELQQAFKDADTALKEEIMEEIDKVNEQLNKLFNAMINMITNIELQATESPISGYENLSFLGAEAHILGTYYGTASDGDVELNGQTVVTRNGEILLDTESGMNSGVVYATINPSNIDFSGITLKVVDSQGNEAPFTATVEKSDRVLKYGITRSSAKSNLYAVKINLDKSKIDAAKTWTTDDASKLKDAAKSILDKLRKPSTTRLNLKEVASDIASVFNNRLTAYALEAEQEVTDGTNKETRTITSKLSLAATAIKPLSYNFLKDNQTVQNLDLPRIPTIQSKLNFNDYKFNWTPIEGMEDISTSVTLKGMPDISSIKIDGSVPAPTVNADVLIVGDKKIQGTVSEDGKSVDFDLNQIEFDATVSIGDIDVSKLKVSYNKTDQTFDVTIPMDDFNKIIEKINAQVGNMIENVNGIVDKVKGYADNIDGKYITRINEFIQKFENLLRKSNSLLQPALFYTTSTGSWNQLAREEIGATYLKLSGGKASTIFIASSYNGEILCPAYKRCIYVSKKPDGATVSGTNLGAIVDSETRKIGFEANKAGTYELTYEAVDYSGIKVSKKFYVKVVE